MKAYAKFDFDRVPQVASPMPHAAPEEEYSNFASLAAIAKTYGGARRAISDTYLAENLASGYTSRLALVGQSRSRQPGLETARHRAFMELGICLWEHYLA
ncbi:hypothetical protein MCOR02_006651 [Pyricularia oryzae]|uniref:Uncharacterized protein n=1 Tax=Pyricularia oryzae TaxID=318829 RepID=A0A4P7NS87_PYROR|nr:hypothetical protein MCOR02_006651 [Pyricularia oryzae]KAI6298257.1 hypothetical protein MCOR34_009286 [Pyricularia oryzae]KAI6452630.1 hypothetical protein MCOR17_009497 [Pyricularia oryzae]KAI6495947.1 hypothetical protein MCOR13_007116 [Pyricularia oryzae]KAI6585504.1 hypothetical protein MCOR04_004682 [Pyricularia oryzae]